VILFSPLVGYVIRSVLFLCRSLRRTYPTTNVSFLYRYPQSKITHETSYARTSCTVFPLQLLTYLGSQTDILMCCLKYRAHILNFNPVIIINYSTTVLKGLGRVFSLCNLLHSTSP
jgi:hypothetical protein